MPDMLLGKSKRPGPAEPILSMLPPPIPNPMLLLPLLFPKSILLPNSDLMFIFPMPLSDIELELLAMLLVLLPPIPIAMIVARAVCSACWPTLALLALFIWFPTLFSMLLELLPRPVTMFPMLLFPILLLPLSLGLGRLALTSRSGIPSCPSPMPILRRPSGSLFRLVGGSSSGTLSNLTFIFLSTIADY